MRNRMNHNFSVVGNKDNRKRKSFDKNSSRIRDARFAVQRKLK